ncbi:SDR family NAD(P)-dependent oxidoreductase [Oceanicoccus sagamiensis]|uniref:3-oxoacyl-ACP reductase n=1 Tax=Oceanicoccus sagamiensis TaxID=716816 RepID=A0A1X9NIA6_9GAMM|nr:SDR family NAD(P)-dependent oxidoreductase [Oceanicoccus sagamiensis]ARN75239.1 3-oxoacyl-ACP reductase [Oceanicoccus sagamiensis]
MKDLFSVAGKVALVTGGSRGIGAMIARGLVENGARVYITARKEEELTATAESLSALGECIAIPGDISTVSGLEMLVAVIAERESQLDILVNNAGATWGETIDAFPETGWDKVMDLNVKSPFFLIQKCLPLLRVSANAEDPARIINIASINGITYPGMPNYSYSASKAAMIQMTSHLAVDLVKEHINVNAIAPGLFPSKMTAFAVDGQEEAVGATIPRGRIGSPEDAAGTVIYLSSRASAWVVGHTLALDGGMIAAAG